MEVWFPCSRTKEFVEPGRGRRCASLFHESRSSLNLEGGLNSFKMVSSYRSGALGSDQRIMIPLEIKATFFQGLCRDCRRERYVPLPRQIPSQGRSIREAGSLTAPSTEPRVPRFEQRSEP